MLQREWFSPGELAAMAVPGLPATTRGVQATADRNDWTRDSWRDRYWRERSGQGGGVEFHYAIFPHAAKIRIAAEFAVVEAADEREQAKRALSREDMWAWFERLPEKKKAEAKRRVEILDTIRALTESGMKKAFAVGQTVAHFKRENPKASLSMATVYGWEKIVGIVPRHDWLPWLAPRHAGRLETVTCDPAAWEMLRSNYLRPEKPTFQRCYRDLVEAAAKHGWAIPAERTLQRRIDGLDKRVVTFAREGREAVERLYPAQRRDRSGFHALEAVNADGHEWDVFVKWPDGKVARPVMIAFQDLYSGMILSWRVDYSENKEAVRLAFGDMVEAWGIPDLCYLDNGRAFASKWISGGVANRYRFKVKEEEPDGIMTMLGVKVHWTTPYHGQSKPIERAFGDMASNIAKHPAFAGAYVGNNPTAKPENYGSRAVPIADFLRVLHGEIDKHNRRAGRRAAVCAGRSFQEVFEESYAKSPIKKATAEQRRLWLLAAQAIGADRDNGEIHMFGNRYWSESLLKCAGLKVVVRFDPGKLHAPLHVYRSDGAYIGEAPCVEDVGFADTERAGVHAKARKARVKAWRAMMEAERTLTPAQVAALLPEPEEAPPPSESKVVRLISGANALKPRQQTMEEPEEHPDEARTLDAYAQAFDWRRGLRVVTDDPGE